MNAAAIAPQPITDISCAPNVIALPTRKRAAVVAQRFKIVEFQNPRTGTKSYRVTGMKRDGERVRENFQDQERAECRQAELQTEWLCGHVEETPRKTSLADDKLRMAETVFIQLGDDWERLPDIVADWKRARENAGPAIESPLLDDAVTEFKNWLDSAECDLSEETKPGYKNRVGMFANSVKNVRVNEIDLEFIKAYLKDRAKPSGPDNKVVGKTTLKNDRRAICRFLSWCVERKYAKSNPAIEPRKRMGKTGGKLHGKLPDLFTVEQCRKLLREAEKHRGGMLAPYVAVCLFAGLRPDSEAERITWEQVNLRDGEIIVTPAMTKTGTPRTIKMHPTLVAWLKAYKGVEFYPSGWRDNFDAVKKAAGITKWIVDGMRHTAHSHYFRKCGSFGLTAEYFGNSEPIVRRHYNGRVTTEETKAFYAILPTKKAGKGKASK